MLPPRPVRSTLPPALSPALASREDHIMRRASAPRAARLRTELLEDRSVPAAAFALSNNALIPFDTATPVADQAPIAVTGLAAGDTLVGIDFRPQNGFLYGLGVNAGADTATLYAVSTRTGVATAVGAAGSI